MPTKPLESILYREFAKSRSQEIINVGSPLIQEVVNHATNAFARCGTSPKGDVDEDAAPLALYHHLIEMVDGIEVLIAQSCGVAGIPLVRSSFEAMLSLQYILEDDEYYSRRSLSWLAAFIRRRIADYESFDPDTDRGRQFAAASKADETSEYMEGPLPDASEARKAKAELEPLLSEPHFQPVEAEFKRLKAQRRRTPHWYQLFGGPPNLERLAARLNRAGQYALFYRSWSQIIHAADFSRVIGPSGDEGSAFLAMRDDKQMADVLRVTPTFLLTGTRLMLKHFRPGEEKAFKAWYIAEIQGREARLP